MQTRRTWLATFLIAALFAGSKSASGDEPDEPRSFLIGRGVSPNLRSALASAAGMLMTLGCQEVLTDFHDGRGRTLRENLDEIGLTPSAYLAQVRFTSGLGLQRCSHSNVLASTSPGSRVVFICGMQFESAQRHDIRHTAHILIHEMLHTLGLGEDPPTSLEITDRVMRRCGP